MRSCCECFAADMYLQAVFVDRLCRVALYCHRRVRGKVYSARSRLDMRPWLSTLGSVFRDSESENETVGTGQGERPEVGSQVTAGDWRRRSRIFAGERLRSFASRSTFTTPPAFSPAQRHAHWHFRTDSSPRYGFTPWKKVYDKGLIDINFPNILSNSYFFVSREYLEFVYL
jgi:hypothetical protein